MAETYRFRAGTVPLLVSCPHDSTYIPDEIAARMTPEALKTPDTDWHVAKLYDFAADLGASVLTPTHSRYVIDLNRDPAGKALYANAANTELCPLTTFDFEPLYRTGVEPDVAEIAARLERYWKPYHRKIKEELNRLKRRFGIAVLFEGHTIRSRVPRFFDGLIPDLNIGTGGGASAAPEVAERVFSLLSESGYSTVLDQRFTGGYITRHYGRPAANVHAVQLELTWHLYMDEATFQYLPERADRLKVELRKLLETLIGWAKAGILSR
jgi:N-formylglutamate deformylase